MEDNHIIQLFFKRSEAAVTELHNKYGNLALSIARRILPDERDSEECLNDACLKVWNAIPPEHPASLPAYFSRIVRNLALDRYSYNHADKRSTALTNAFEELEACLPSSFNVEEAACSLEFKRFLNQFLAKLSKENRIYFVRRYWYGENISSIATAYQVSEEKIKSSLFRTRNKLRTALEKEGASL